MIKKTFLAICALAIFATGAFADMDFTYRPWSESETSATSSHYGMMGYQMYGGIRGYAPQSRHYEQVQMNLEEDIFINRSTFQTMMEALDIDINFVDDNADGIADIFQNTEQFEKFGIAFEDTNDDTIADVFQTRQMYNFMGMANFVDIDSDNLSDNYRSENFYGHGIGYMATYENIDINLQNDVYQNRDTFMDITAGTYKFIDVNGDNIADIFQNSSQFVQNFPELTFKDSNEDTIHDGFQTHGFYRAVGMENFMDTDNDGICDNYATYAEQ